jgi:PAS domain S-box-containing protein
VLPFETGSLQNRHLLTMLSEAFGESEAEALRSSLVSRRAFRKIRMHSVRGQHQSSMVIELNGEPLKDIGGEFCGWHGTLTDVTSLDKIQAALREKDVEIRGTLRSLAEGVVVQDADGRIMEWNPAALSILGLTAEQISGRSFFDPEWHAIDVQGRDLPGDQHPAIIALATGEIQQQVVMGLESPGRSRRWLSVNAVPLIFEERVTRVVTSFRDITMEMDSKKELRELNQELEMRVLRRTASLEAAGKNLKESLVALEARALAQQRLIYILSHDLREPLNAIINFTRVLTERQQETLSASGKKYFSFISSSAARMKMLLDDLLKYVRLEAGNVSPVDISLDDLLKEIQEDMRDSLDKAGAVLVVNTPVTVTGDRTLIRILMQNLVANAIKFVPPDRAPHVGVSATATSDKQACVITVRDNGIGIPEDSLDRIFDLFARLNHRSKFEGTGLGLAICRRIVEMHHGNITVSSELNLGSTFVVTLPLANASIERNL